LLEEILYSDRDETFYLPANISHQQQLSRRQEIKSQKEMAAVLIISMQFSCCI
jgi:hypothetical protein